MSSIVDNYLKALESWKEEIAKLREIILETNLEEGMKWGKLCYSLGLKNIAIIQPFKNCLGMTFFKGSLLKDSKGILVDNGPNSQAARRFEFTSTEEITQIKTTIKAYIKEAIAIENSGLKVKFKKKPEPAPKELLQMFTKKAKLKTAFEALTPGRQRGYILHFRGAKQSATRLSRIEKCIPRILAGKGLND